MQCRYTGLCSVKDFFGKSSIGEELTKGHKISVGINLVFLQTRTAHLWSLRDQGEIFFCIKPSITEGFKHHAVGCRAKGNGHGSTLEFGKTCHIAIDGDHNSISGTIWAVGQCADEDCFGITRSFSTFDQINHRREITHEADLNLTSHHFISNGRA